MLNMRDEIRELLEDYDHFTEFHAETYCGISEEELEEAVELKFIRVMTEEEVKELNFDEDEYNLFEGPIYTWGENSDYLWGGFKQN